MYIQADVKSLEWLACAYLSQDKVAYEEINNRVDQHSSNQERFHLPSRIIAKIFVFRLIYGGSAYSYSTDPDFASVKYNEKAWQGVIDEFYSKYSGIYRWHTSLVQEASNSGRIRIPTGRIFDFAPERRGTDLVWPRTKILNYPVQGFGADLVAIARVIAFSRWKRIFKKVSKPITTVHDSIVFDCMPGYVEEVGRMLLESVQIVPKYCPRLFDFEFDLPLTAEIKVGKDLTNMKEIKL